MAIFTVPHDNLTDQRQNTQMDDGSADEIGGDVHALQLIND